MLGLGEKDEEVGCSTISKDLFERLEKWLLLSTVVDIIDQSPQPLTSLY